ncbi:hypothetical protein BVRB_8g190910 [Beta vulgaris subsp. vulgaris]|nr:hypothetical protein BVRB_8g190910 [Beta vulgaris subsp. vulgaris]
MLPLTSQLSCRSVLFLKLPEFCRFLDPFFTYNDKFHD